MAAPYVRLPFATEHPALSRGKTILGRGSRGGIASHTRDLFRAQLDCRGRVGGHALLFHAGTQASCQPFFGAEFPSPPELAFPLASASRSLPGVLPYSRISPGARHYHVVVGLR